MSISIHWSSVPTLESSILLKTITLYWSKCWVVKSPVFPQNQHTMTSDTTWYYRHPSYGYCLPTRVPVNDYSLYCIVKCYTKYSTCWSKFAIRKLALHTCTLYTLQYFHLINCWMKSISDIYIHLFTLSWWFSISVQVHNMCMYMYVQ